MVQLVGHNLAKVEVALSCDESEARFPLQILVPEV